MPFSDRKRQIDRLIEAVELNVLVWGPGPGGGEHYAKRVQVRERIQSAFRYAEVFFSEELDKLNFIEGAEVLSLAERELWHLATGDICVVLDTSAGAAAEIAYFLGSPYGRKLLILTHEQYQNTTSFPGALRAQGNQLFYTNDEYTSCQLSEKIIARLRQIALNKMGGLLT